MDAGAVAVAHQQAECAAADAAALVLALLPPPTLPRVVAPASQRAVAVRRAIGRGGR